MPQIEVPSKWDIIPLHTSDRAAFKQCRRKWYWSSPAQSNLVPKASVYGIYPPFWFGTGIHYALQNYYNPELKEDPEVTFDTWYYLQWNGGIIKESELKAYEDRMPELNKTTGHWEIQGLADVLPDPDPEEFEGFRQLGLGMMRFYKEYALKEDNFDVVCTEHTFSVPILNPDGTPLYMVDTREMPEDWEPTDTENMVGRLMTGHNKEKEFAKQVHARGRMDLIVQSHKTGKFVLLDHKTHGGAIDDEYFSHLDLDEQCTTYSWAAELEAKLYDLPYKEIAGIVYQVLRKAAPRPPTALKSGVPSVDRSKESTTPKLFEKFIKESGLEPIFASDDKMQSYYTYLVSQGDGQFIQRRSVMRNQHQKDNAGYRIYMEAQDMLGDPYIYPNPTKDWACKKCVFRQPCVALEAGYDWEHMIQDGYERNHDR
jgi:hypothetical protein